MSDPVAPPQADAGQPKYLSGGFATASKAASIVCLVTGGAALCVMTLIILWQVFARYVLNNSPSWSEQAALYLLVWIVGLGAAAGVRERFHIRIEAVQDALTGGGRSIMVAVSHVVIGLIGLFLTVYGTQLVTALWGVSIPTLGVPRGSALIPLPLAGFLMTLFSIEHLIAMHLQREVRPLWH